MKAEIEKIINDNLPSMAAAEMKKYIIESEAQAEQLASANREIDCLKKDIHGWEKKSAEYARALGYLKKADEIMMENEAAGIELTKREHALSNTIMTTQMVGMQTHMATMERLVDKVFGHPGVTVTSQRKIPVAAHTTGQNGCMEGGEYVEQHEETETKTEGKS